MEHKSLVGIKATDITHAIGEHGYFAITSYNTPIALVLPYTESKRELYQVIAAIVKELEETNE